MTNYSLAITQKTLLGKLMSVFRTNIIALISLLSLWIILASPAYGDNSQKLRGEVFCYPAKTVPKIKARLDSIKAARRDVVNVQFDPKFIIKDGGAWPDNFYLAQGDDVVTYMPFSRKDGRVPTFLEAVSRHPNTDICVKDLSRAHRSEHDEGLYFEMGLSPIFHNSSGTHSAAELEKGMQDAKIFYKKMIPAALRPFMPETRYLAVKYSDLALQDPQAEAQIYAQTTRGPVLLDMQRYKEKFVIAYKDMQKIDASALIIRGGAYTLQPVPSPKFMRRFDKGTQEGGQENSDQMDVDDESLSLK